MSWIIWPLEYPDWRPCLLFPPLTTLPLRCYVYCSYEFKKKGAIYSSTHVPNTTIAVNFHAALANAPLSFECPLLIFQFVCSFICSNSILFASVACICGHSLEGHDVARRDSYTYNMIDVKGKWIDHTLTCLALRFIVHLTSSATWYYELNTNVRSRSLSLHSVPPIFAVAVKTFHGICPKSVRRKFFFKNERKKRNYAFRV